MEASGQSQSLESSSSSTEIIRYKTVVKSAHSLVDWNIDNFTLICPNPSLTKFSGKDKGEFFSLFSGTKSPVYKTILPGSVPDQKPIELEWYFALEFTAADIEKNASGDRENHMTFGLHFEDYKEAESLGLIFSIAIIGREDAVVFKKGPIATTLSKFNPKRILMWPKFLLVKRLWDNEHTYLVNDVLHLRIDLTISRKPFSWQVNNPAPAFSSWAAADLIDDMGQLLKSQNGADITVHCGQGKTFMVHSSILKARSPVFERMFAADMTESVSKSVTIEDVDPLDFEAFIEYIYTSKITFPMENLPRLVGLVRVADKYEMIKLKAFCFELIFKLISLDNAGEIAVVAYLLSADDEVRDAVSKFCLENWSVLTQDMSFRECVEQNPCAFLTTLAVKKPRLGVDEILPN